MQKIPQKILLYNDKVAELRAEFKYRLDNKRNIIKKTKHKMKELALKDATVICSRCSEEVALMKTLKYFSAEKHHAKCSFGYLRRVEIDHIIQDENKRYLADEGNRGYIDLYMETWKSEDPKFKENSKLTDDKTYRPKYAFCECQNHHIVGFIQEEKFYFSDISELQIMFPNGFYQDWCEKYWVNGYSEAFAL